MAIQGLWSMPYLMEVGGFDRASAARHLLAIGLAMLAGYLSIGMLSMPLRRRGVLPRHLFAGAFTLNALALAAITASLPGSYLWWTLYGLGASANILGFAVLAEGFAREVAARANTALNLLMFTGSFATQWGIGVIVDAARAMLGFDTASGLRLAFATMLALDAATVVWFATKWRLHASPRIVVTG
jgi:hypothetical protein